MDAFDLVDLRLPAEIGGKIFEIRRLRLCDVLRILNRFDDELRAFVAKENPNALELFDSLSLEDTADLLAYSLDPYDPLHLRKHLTLKLAIELSHAIGRINDIPRIWESLKIGQPTPAPTRPELLKPDEPEIDSLVKVVDQLAARYGIDPLTIPTWSYEAFLTLVDAADADRIAKERQALLLNGLDPDLLDDSAIKAEPIADLNKWATH